MTGIEIIVQISIAIVSTLATLAAAYFGARYAFEFQNNKNAENDAIEAVKSANMAIFSMMRSHHELTAIKQQFIDPKIEDEDRHFSIMPSSSNISHLDLSFNDLSFLLHSKDPNILNELALTQSQVNAAIDIVNSRSKFHMTEFQPLLEVNHDRLSETSDLKEMEKIVGIRATRTLISITDAMIHHVDFALEILAKDSIDLQKAAKAMYPNHGIVKMSFKKS